MTIKKIQCSAEDVVKLCSLLVGGEGFGLVRTIWGVPRGGVPVALTCAVLKGWVLVDRWQDADLIVDDLIDSGATAARFVSAGKRFGALYEKKDPTEWIEFPWEASMERDMEEHIDRLIQIRGLELTVERRAALATAVEGLQ